MIKLIETIQRVAQNVLISSKPMSIVYGKVLKTSPLQIQLSQKLILGNSFFVAREGQQYEVGDELILLQDNGGQRYLIFGRKGELK